MATKQTEVDSIHKRFDKVMVIVEDNTFDFKVRDRLKKEWEERNFHMGEDTLSMMFLDMITYCSRGNEEAAVLNLIATEEFRDGIVRVSMRLIGGWQGLMGLTGLTTVVTGWELMFEFWKKCFIKIKVLVQKQETLPAHSYTEVISRDYGRFLLEHNFANLDALKAEVKVAIDSLKNESENTNNIYKDILRDA